MTDIDTTFWHMARTAIAVILLLMAVAVGISGAVARSVIKPLERLRLRMAELSEGKLGAPIEGYERSDEIGAMARTVQVFKDNAISIRLQLEQQEAKDQVEVEKRHVLTEIAGKFEEKMQGIVDDVRRAASTMQQALRQLSRHGWCARKVVGRSSRSRGGHSNVQTVAAAAEELSASIGEIGRQVAHAAATAERAAEESGRTNGESKRRYCNHITSIQMEISEAVEAIARIGSTIAEVNGFSGTIAAAVEQQNLVTLALTKSVQQTADGTEHVSRNICDVRGSLEYAGGRACNVGSAADHLADLGELLGSEIDAFVGMLRVA